MTEYTKLSQTLQKTINMHVDDTLYPRKCLIKNVHDDGNVDAVVVIGEETLFTNLICFGDGKIGDEGIFIPLLNDYNQNIVITDNAKSYSKKEIDSKIDELNEAFETQLTEDYIQSLIDALEKEDEELNQKINNITADLDNVSANLDNVSADVLKKEDKANKVSDITDESTDVQYPTAKAVYDKFNSIIDIVYPVGSIYMSANSVSPKVLFGGEWEQLKDAFLLASGDVYEAGSTGGSATVTLTEEQMPSHTHIQNSHNHTQNAHNHTQNQHRHEMVGSKTTGISSGTYLRAGAGSEKDSKYTAYTTPTNKEATATNNSATATNQSAGGGQPHDNMPPYLSIYAWKRIS